MVSVGSKAMSHQVHEDESHKRSRKKKKKQRPNEGGGVREQIDLETIAFFSEIADGFKTERIELEERSKLCSDALEKIRGKEFEFCTSKTLSSSLCTILPVFDVENLCAFLKGCVKDFTSIAKDDYGSDVVRAAFKSVALHPRPDLILDALTLICQAVEAKVVDLMGTFIASRVLRDLLCLCKGVSPEKTGFYLPKSAMVAAERLKFVEFPLPKDDDAAVQIAYPKLFTSLISSLLKPECIATLDNKDTYPPSLVFQTILRLLAGNEEKLLHVIPIILRCKTQNKAKGICIALTDRSQLRKSFVEPGFCNIMEVVVEVFPKGPIFMELFGVFLKHLFKLSSGPGKFAVEALIHHLDNKYVVNLVFEELSPNMDNLFQKGMSGLVYSLILACERVHDHENECCEIIADTFSLEDDCQPLIVPRLLFLDCYFTCEDKSSWSWSGGVSMNIMGSLILQAIFRFGREHIQAIQPYIESITSMEATHVLEAVRDSHGSHVIEAFLCSGASKEQKRELVGKLKNHFGELALAVDSSAVEECFTCSSVKLQEAIVSEMLTVKSELAKTTKGSSLLRRLDVDGYAASPDHWRSTQTSKARTRNDESDHHIGSNADSRKTGKKRQRDGDVS